MLTSIQKTVLTWAGAAALVLAHGVGPALAQKSITVTGISSFKLVEELLPEFTKKTGIEVDLQILPYPQLRQKAMADLVGGTANSDVYTQDIVWLGEWAANNYARPLDDLMARDAAEIDTQDILPGALNALSKWDGKTWSVPFGAYYFLMYYRPDQFATKNLKPPVTLVDVTSAAEKLTNKSANQFGIAMPYRRGTPIASWFLATYTGAGGKLLADPPSNFAPTLDTPLAEQVLQAYLDWQKYAPAGAIDYHWNDQTVAMQTGRLAMAPTFSINGTEFVKPEKSVVSDKVGFTYMPRAQANDKPVVPFGGWAVAINANSPKVEESWTFLKWLLSPDVQLKLGKLNGTPVRYSSLQNPELQKMYPWLASVLQAEKEGLVYPDYRPRYPFYPKLEEALGLQLNRAALGEISVAEALKTANQQITEIIREAGHPVK